MHGADVFSQVKKPLIEKRRRERINKCLRELKKFVLNATAADVSSADSSVYFLHPTCYSTMFA